MKTSYKSIFLLAAVAVTSLNLHASESADGDQMGYTQTNLVANSKDYHPQIIDPNMIDAWGIAVRPAGIGGHIWISDAASGFSSEFIGDVNGQPLHQDGLKAVKLDAPGFTDHGYAFLSGQAYNIASDFPNQPAEFVVTGPAQNRKMDPPQAIKGGFNGPAKFAFVTEDGCINAWSSNTATAMESAPIMVDYSKTAKWIPFRVNCVFTGAAFTYNAAASDAYKKAGGNHLFATDVRNNTIMVFDNKWKDVTSTYHFAVPASVGKLSPYNVVDLGGHLFVTYAKFDPSSDEGQEQIHGAGLGHLVEYNEDGSLAIDFHDKGILDAPWGVAIAPSTFGRVASDVLVANFGDGTITAFDAKTGDFDGYIRDSDSKIISIDGLWGLAFGNGTALGDSNALYFTAGPNGEFDGVFGRINARTWKPEASNKPTTAAASNADLQQAAH